MAGTAEEEEFGMANPAQFCAPTHFCLGDFGGSASGIVTISLSQL